MNVYENRGQLGNVADRTNRVRQDNTGSVALMREKQRTWDIGVKGVEMFLGKVQEEQDRRTAVDAMSLNSEYSSRMTELQTRLMTNKEGAARDNVRLLDEGRQKIVDEISANSKDRYSLQTINVFRGMCNKDYVKTRDNMVKYVAGENEKFESNTLLQQKTVMVNDFASEFESDDALGNALERGRAVIAAGLNGYGEARVNDEFKKYRADLVEAGVNAALNAKNFDRANDLLTGESGEYLDPKVRERLQKDFDGRVLTHKTTEGVRGLFVETEGNYALMRSRFEKEFLSPGREEQEKQWKMFDNQFESLRRQARNSFDSQYDRIRQGIRAMVNGNMDYAALQAECEKAAGGDRERADQYKLIADLELAKGGDGLSKEGMSSALRLILNRSDDIRNKQYLLELLHDGDACRRLFGGVPSKGQIKQLEQEYDDFTHGRGPYKFDWSGAMTQVMASREVLDVTKDMDKAQVPVLKSVLETMGQEFVRRYLQDKSHLGEMPSFDTVVRYCRQAAVRTNHGVYETHWFSPDETVNVSEAEKWRMGIRNITRTQDGKFRVTYLDGNEPPRDLDGEDLMNEINLAGGRKAE